MPVKKQPLRHCVACNAEKTKKELVRIVRSKEGDISVDLTGKKPGRGAYLCHDAACLAKAKKTKRLEHVFSCAIDPAIYQRLEQELTASPPTTPGAEAPKEKAKGKPSADG